MLKSRTAGAHAGAKLTGRERDVLRLLVDGKTYREIAGDLHVSGHTAREYIARLYGKLHVNRRSTCVAVAIAAGLLGDEAQTDS